MIMLRWWLLLASTLVVLVCDAKVRRYAQTVAPSSSSYVWSPFFTPTGLVYSADVLNDDSVYLLPIPTCIPFFHHDSAELFISSNGYLATSPVAPCRNFCPEFVDWRQNGGPSPLVPQVSPFATDLNPGTGGQVGFWSGNRSFAGENIPVSVAMWNQVFPFTSAAARNTFEAEIWPNGTIIFRYAIVYPASGSQSAFGIRFASGLAWSQTQKVVSPNVWTSVFSSVPNYAAIRFDPYDDPCTKHTNCSACTSSSTSSGANSTTSNNCLWCSATSECIPQDVAGEVCPRRGAVASCTRNMTASEQRFYNVEIRTRPRETIANLPSATLITWSGNNATPMPLNFSFPFFHSGPNATNATGGTSPRIFKSVFARSNGTLSFFSENGGCGPMRSTFCESDGLSFSITPFQLPTPVAASEVRVANFSERAVGSSFCQVGSLMARPGASSCPQAVVFEFTIRQTLTAAPTSNITRTTFQIYFDALGGVQIHFFSIADTEDYFPGVKRDCPSNIPWRLQDTPKIGVLRTNYDDVSSIVIPWDMLNANTTLELTPATDNCEDCNHNGYCNTTSRRCVCNGNFAGDGCTECKSGHYGPRCLPCFPCANGGTCNDGYYGSGYCTCVSPFSGRNCTDVCPAGTPLVCTSGCENGYCFCGQCRCNTDAGWYGDRCHLWADPCRRYALDGCPTCVSTKTINCHYCLADQTCMASADQAFNIGNRSTCSQSPIKSAADSTCRVQSQPTPPDSRFAIITVIVVFAALGLCGCMTLMTVCICRKRPTNPLVTSAVPGVADFSFPRREREVIGISRLPVQGRSGRPVQGIPLKQIPLRDLVLMQREKRKTAAATSTMHDITDRGDHFF